MLLFIHHFIHISIGHSISLWLGGACLNIVDNLSFIQNPTVNLPYIINIVSPLFEKEKHPSESVVDRRILPKEIANSVCKKGYRLAHLYGLPKIHKERLAMRPILSAKDANNYALAKWLDEKLKPLSINEYTISDIFQFSEEFQHLKSVRIISWCRTMSQPSSLTYR